MTVTTIGVLRKRAIFFQPVEHATRLKRNRNSIPQGALEFNAVDSGRYRQLGRPFPQPKFLPIRSLGKLANPVVLDSFQFDSDGIVELPKIRNGKISLTVEAHGDSNRTGETFGSVMNGRAYSLNVSRPSAVPSARQTSKPIASVTTRVEPSSILTFTVPPA